MTSFMDGIAASSKAAAERRLAQERLQKFIPVPVQMKKAIENLSKLHDGKLTWKDITENKLELDADQQLWNLMISTPDTTMLSCFEFAGNSKISGFPATDLKDIGTKHDGKALAIQGKVVSQGEREPDPMTIKWKCLNCGVLNEPGKFGRQPQACLDCKNDEFDVELTEDTKDTQVVRIQQDGAKISVIVRDESLINSLKSGRTAYAFGVMVFEPYIDRQTKKAKFRKYLEATNLECDEQVIQVSEDDKMRFQADMSEPMFYNKILASVAPHIHSMEAAKESGMLALASIGMRRPARMLWIGDPGVAKSELMEYFAEIAPNGHYTTMANSRYTGLTTTSEKDEETGRWMVTPGLLAYAHNGLVAIDELQVIREQDAKNLNDVIERGKIRYALAGGNHGEMDANCALILACNPHQGRVFENENIQETLKFLGSGAPAFISRMTLIYFFRDKANVERDTQIAKAVVKNSGDNPLAAYSQDWKDESGAEYYGTETLKKFFQYISTIPVEPVPEELHQELIDYYSKNRQDIASRINKLLTPRFLRDAVKLAQMVARIQGQSKPSKADIDKAMDLLANHMEETAFDPKTQEIDVNLVNGNKSKKELAEEKAIDNLFMSLVRGVGVTKKDDVSEEIIIQELVKCGKWDANTAKERLLRAQTESVMWQPRMGWWKFV